MFFERQKLGATNLRWLYLVMTAFAAVVILFSLSKEESQVEVIWTFVAFIIVVVGTYFLVFEIPAFTKITAHSIQIKYRPWIWNWLKF